MKDLGRKLFCLRALHGYTQAYVAKQIGVSTTIYVGIEKDASAIPVKRLGSIAALYDLTLENMFAFNERDLVDLIKGRIPAILQEEFLPQMVSKLDSMNKLLCQLVQHSIYLLKNKGQKPD
jgi:Predicted transcriptional regulators